MMKYFAIFAASASLLCADDFRTGQAARLIIGQSTFTSQDTGASNILLGAAASVAFANDTLVVADSNRVTALPINNRLLIYRSVSTKFPSAQGEIPANTGKRCPVCGGTANVVVGQPDFTSSDFHAPTNANLRTPSSVATDGKYLAVADTDNNRVLIWNTIPTTNGAPADVVLGQPDFTTVIHPVVTASSFRGPQGVWIQGTKLFVVDTQDNRVMVWNHIPTTNNQAADFVLGQANFTTVPQPDLTHTQLNPAANNLLSPVAVTSDGVHLFVADLGYHRVLIWNTIPTQTQQAADVVIGQPDGATTGVNNTPALCKSNGTGTDGKPTYPAMCGATLSFPRFALSDGMRLFVSDGGNDRVLIYDTIPTHNGQTANIILGQLDEFTDQVSDATNNLRSSANTIRTPMGLAWDGTNLYVADPYDRRVLVFTPGYGSLPLDGVKNAASFEVFALGLVTFSGTIQANDTIDIKIKTTEYKYTVLKADTVATISQAMVNLINAGAGDPNAYATESGLLNGIIFTARASGVAGNAVTFTVTLANTTASTTPKIVVTPTSGSLSGGQDASSIAPGTLLAIVGQDFTGVTAGAPTNVNPIPPELAGVEVYIDGIRAPVFFVSKTQINSQMPFEVKDATNVSLYVRVLRDINRLTISNAVNVPIVAANPGLFARGGKDPRPAVAVHSSSHGTSTVSVDGAIKAGDVGTITIGTTAYNYTVVAADTLITIEAALIKLINADANQAVTASPAAAFNRIILTAKKAGTAGNGIAVTTKLSTGASLVLTALTGKTCCANTAGAMVTKDNPAIGGETIIVYSTGLGLVGPDPGPAASGEIPGYQYRGPEQNTANELVSAIVGGKSADVLSAGLAVGMVGVYAVKLELSTASTTNPDTQAVITAGPFFSNVVTIPVKAP